MAEALITIAAEGVLKKVLSIAANEIVIAWGYEEKLTTLHDLLDLIRAKLRDAERQKGTEAVMVWLKQLKDVVSEADDVLDEVHYEMLRREVKKRDWIARKVPTLPSLKKLSFRREMSHKIENVSKKLFEINKRANDLRLENEQSIPVSNSLCRETDPYLDEFKIIGRGNDELHIIELLTHSRKDENLKIVPIVGMGGIGKTTLAKSIYNNPKIEQHFDVRAWLCVSVKIEVNTLLANIYEALAGKECESRTRVNIIKDLQKELGSKTYLLVLDDVWDEERAHWDDFRTCMLKVNSQNGSGILVTTRNLEIGTLAMSEEFRALQGLSDDQCWSIFKEIAFVAGEPSLRELEEIGRDIVKKCRGLPLLVNVIGGMLRNYNDKAKWLSIRDSKVWDLEGEGDRVQNTLKLSFDNLPNSIVKQCFAYCSIFQKGSVMKGEELVQLWMALGFVQGDEARNKDMEDVGNDIVEILVSNLLLQDVTRDEYGYVAGCSMHDLLHDLSSSLVRHESLRLVHPTHDDIMRIPQVKHLSVYRHWKDDVRINISLKKMSSVVFKDEMKARSLHTLFFEGEVENNISFQHFKSLRILKLDRCRLCILDESIGELTHLKYLDLSNTEVGSLPKSIGKLYHLQTLKLCGCRSFKINHLRRLPIEFRNLISLRHFEFPDTVPINNVGQLTSLRTLPSFHVLGKKGHQIEELGPLKHLGRKLRILNLEKVKTKKEATKADLYGKKNLSKIELCWNNKDDVANRNDKDVLEGLQPHENLQSLTIYNFSGDNFPQWVSTMAIGIEGKWTPLHKLVDIKLIRCHNCRHLPMLENLPLLRDLVLRNMDNLTCLSGFLVKKGDKVTGSGSIKPLSPSLRSLQLIGMERLEKWMDAATNSSTLLSPVLEKLYIYNCPKIAVLDECHPHPLLSLKIKNCKNLKSIKSIEGLASLESLSIDGCHSLMGLPDFHNQGHSLKRLSVTECNKLTSLPPKMFECFSILSRLKLGPFSKELHSFPSLRGIKKLRNHLHSLELNGWDHLESIPEEIKHLISLSRLTIQGFGMRELPIWLTNMSSIRYIAFNDCKRLDKETIKRGAPTDADNVLIDGCRSV
ncbi:unnamed protein product [Lactuca saligna]|uniref:Disease resistance protein RGA3 n=1 Tax=Lactuca saligna TaxID=75948 RepID=A0AA35YNI0_LACSI|nr:unnamed protein product [Lactuca saligna]